MRIRKVSEIVRETKKFLGDDSNTIGKFIERTTLLANQKVENNNFASILVSKKLNRWRTLVRNRQYDFHEGGRYLFFFRNIYVSSFEVEKKSNG